MFAWKVEENKSYLSMSLETMSITFWPTVHPEISVCLVIFLYVSDFHVALCNNTGSQLNKTVKTVYGQ